LPVLCGIGITCSDLPVLHGLFRKHRILSETDDFVFQSKFRVLEQSVAGPAINLSANRFLYPSRKNELSNWLGTEMISGAKGVLKLFESKEYKSIQDRSVDEIQLSFQLYKRTLSTQ